MALGTRACPRHPPKGMSQESKPSPDTDCAMAKQRRPSCETLSPSLLPKGSPSSRQPSLTFQDLSHHKLPEKVLLLLQITYHRQNHNLSLLLLPTLQPIYKLQEYPACLVFLLPVFLPLPGTQAMPESHSVTVFHSSHHLGGTGRNP